MGDDNVIWHKVLKMHGYQILGAVLREWSEENVIVTTVALSCLSLIADLAHSFEAAANDKE
jgi:hypothetical protein